MDDTITRLRKQIRLKDEARNRASERHRAALAALTPVTLAGYVRLWWRGHRVASWRCRCGRRLGDSGHGCEWHMVVRAQAIAGLITEDEAR